MTRLLPIDLVVESLKREEGWSSTVYRCSENKMTLGYGRNVDPDGGIGITREEGEMLLRNDVNRVIDELKAAFDWFPTLDNQRAAVLIEIAFQLGTGARLRGFKKFIDALRRFDHVEAAAELLNSRYARQTPERVRRYANRLLGVD